jgi:diphthamide synthase subunit DPH2
MKTASDPIIFLDIDGVLCTQNQWKPDVIAEDGYSEFNVKCVQNLNRLIEQTKAKVILTTSRRINKTLEEFRAIMERRGFRGVIVGKINQRTTLNSSFRSDEIVEWLETNGLPDKYLILDDDTRLVQMGQPYVEH